MADSAAAIAIINIPKFCPMLSLKLNELINTNNVTANNIISMLIINNIIFFLFKINPKIPIKNKNNDRFIVMFLYFVIYPIGILIKAKNLKYYIFFYNILR